MDDRDVFLGVFRKHGIDVDKIHIHRVGSDAPKADPAHVKKAAVVRRYLDSGLFTTVQMFDDSTNNITKFMSLQAKYPGIHFTGYLVGKDASVTVVRGA